jgi:hypothetical protein
VKNEWDSALSLRIVLTPLVVSLGYNILWLGNVAVMMDVTNMPRREEFVSHMVLW